MPSATCSTAPEPCSLRHGRVEFAGIVSQTPHFVLAVTGRTGTYTGARGTLVFDNDNGRQLLTLRLRH